jgi:hypothetical protein
MNILREIGLIVMTAIALGGCGIWGTPARADLRNHSTVTQRDKNPQPDPPPKPGPREGGADD